ncbi:MAG: metallophosphoesterase family protein, partial [Gemmatimonadaceae bacterium]|nr:metallophosphoesterase family protein [Gemmatimonadaceae bacterium]
MLVGLLSDTHDRLPAIEALLLYMQKRGVGMVLHVGDFCAPFSLKPFIDLNIPMVGVFGRNDGDH